MNICVKLIGIRADGLPVQGPELWVNVPATTTRSELLAMGPARHHGTDVIGWRIGNWVDEYGNCIPLPESMR